MPHDIGYVDNTSQLAHYAMLEQIRDFAADNGWAVLRYDTAPDNRELILKGAGYSGEEEIFVGFRTYQNAAADYYNLCAAGFTGYVPGNPFDSQPGAMLSGIPCHNQRVDYWLTLNPKRIALGMKVGTPVYELGYAGKYLPYARPSQYPYPLAVGGMLNGTPATRFSDSGHSMPFRGGANMRALFNDGVWHQPDCWPYANPWLAGATTQERDSNDNYALNTVVLSSSTLGDLGELDGVAHITGFNNATENTALISGETWVVLQDAWRTGFNDYVALRMDS